ncbi:MAG: hypothetical protein IT184_10645 [Acidobacteria bacterium]|nr:hypothetical protein [Acidobacteriota bacterium]
MRGISAALVLGALSVAPLRADLQYTLKTEAHASTVKPAAAPNPLFTMLSSLVLGMIAPPGGTEMTVTVGDRGTRVDYPRAFAIVPAGGAVIVRPDGSTIVVNPPARTFWKAPKLDGTAGGITPDVRVQRTGTFATIAGVRAEHADVEIRMPLPAGGAALPGLPAELTMAGDAWFSDAHKRYARPSGALSALAGSLGIDGVANAGFLMRSVLRSELFGPQELESVVTAIREVDVPADTFEVPAGFTEVPPPAFGVGGMLPGAAR